MQCSINEKDVDYFENTPTLVVQGTSLNQNQKECLSEELSERGYSDEEIKARGLK